jgi:hypothetical protein
MTAQDTKAKLTESLNRAIALDTIYSSPDFQNHLLPALQKLAEVQIIDPLTYTTREEFARACDIAFAKAIVHRDLLKFLSSQRANMEALRKQINMPERSFQL